jgi:8-oxo-dGTP pyrophosphatase MutT (NUDIX family)
MELARDLTLIVHFIGLAMILGPFLIQMRAHTGYSFSWVLAGGSV